MGSAPLDLDRAALAVPAVPDRGAEDPAAEPDVETLAAEDLLGRGGDLGVGAGQDAVQVLQHDRLRAEPAPDRAEFEADVAGADDDQALGHVVVGEGLRAGPDPVAVEFDARQGRRPRTRGDDHVAGRQLALAVRCLDDDALQAAVLADRAAEPRPALDVFDPVLLQQRGNAAGQRGHHSVLALHHRPKVEPDLARDAAVRLEFAPRRHQPLARLEQRLARDAAHPQADPARRRVLVDHRRPETELRRPDRGHVAARPGADDEEVEGGFAHPVDTTPSRLRATADGGERGRFAFADGGVPV